MQWIAVTIYSIIIIIIVTKITQKCHNATFRIVVRPILFALYIIIVVAIVRDVRYAALTYTRL